MEIDAPLPLPHPELNADPLLGAGGYRVQTALQAGSCRGERNDSCPTGLRNLGSKQNPNCKECEKT